MKLAYLVVDILSFRMLEDRSKFRFRERLVGPGMNMSLAEKPSE